MYVNLDDLLEAWRVNNVITLELLDLCPDETFELKPGKGKTIRSNFVHIVWLRAQAILEKFSKADVPKLDWKTATREEITDALNQTHQQMGDVFRKRIEKPVKMGVLTFFSYLIAHEAHHRSQIEIALRLNGAEPKEELAFYNLWQFEKK
ncbi:MAG: hypothetical protein QOJ65_1389 [Fimbriimonadaceae bacterium]|nr:hypothetical protein [Fimbriimonadaceae bacterium]